MPHRQYELKLAIEPADKTDKLPPVRLRERNKHEACAPSSAFDAHTCRRHRQMLRVPESLRLPRLRRSSEDIIIQILAPSDLRLRAPPKGGRASSRSYRDL